MLTAPISQQAGNYRLQFRATYQLGLGSLVWTNVNTEPLDVSPELADGWWTAHAQLPPGTYYARLRANPGFVTYEVRVTRE